MRKDSGNFISFSRSHFPCFSLYLVVVSPLLTIPTLVRAVLVYMCANHTTNISEYVFLSSEHEYFFRSIYVSFMSRILNCCTTPGFFFFSKNRNSYLQDLCARFFSTRVSGEFLLKDSPLTNLVCSSTAIRELKIFVLF